MTPLVLLFAGLADDEGTAPQRWKNLKEKLLERLHQWAKGCTEDHVIGSVPEAKLLELLKDSEGDLDVYRLRTLGDRLGLQDKTTEAIGVALRASGQTWRALIIAAATGIKDGASEGTCCAPGYEKVTLTNLSVGQAAFVFIADESPLHRKLGVYENHG
jgi:putative ATP-dependent endonuclease of OLD family